MPNQRCFLFEYAHRGRLVPHSSGFVGLVETGGQGDKEDEKDAYCDEGFEESVARG